jgi:HD-GYP domain-containing protein (c-di-GMP phosphodiesterase class II)
MSNTKIQLTSGQIQLLKKFAKRMKRFGFEFAVFDIEKNCVFNSKSNMKEGNTETIPLNKLAQIVKKLFEQESSSLYQDREITAVSFAVNNCSTFGFAGILYPNAGSESEILDESNQFCIQMLSMFVEHFQDTFKSEKQLEVIGDELSSAYEQLVLLNDISTSMKVTESDCAFLQSACDRLTDIVAVEGIAVLLKKQKDGKGKMELSAGSGIIDINPKTAALFTERLVEQLENGKLALVDSNSGSPFEYKWQTDIKSIIIVPFFGRDKKIDENSANKPNTERIIGLMAAVNTVEKDDFDSKDIKLFTSVANACSVFVENIHLFDDLKDLFLGSLKSLTSSIDAKDRYTHGHSERVALISRWIAERIAEKLDLSQKYVYQVYLAGLMHDVGKIGVDEAVLRKEGKLTDQEYEAIKMHSAIGAEILGGIKQMRDIVSGVLSHHERIDGRGYPQGLSGDEIPLIAKIVCLADSFDAMTSKRSYRNAMTLEQALEEVERNTGTQFDGTVAEVFLSSDVYRLWNMLQQGYETDYKSEVYQDYENLAVETLVR